MFWFPVLGVVLGAFSRLVIVLPRKRELVVCVLGYLTPGAIDWYLIRGRIQRGTLRKITSGT